VRARFYWTWKFCEYALSDGRLSDLRLRRSDGNASTSQRQVFKTNLKKIFAIKLNFVFRFEIALCCLKFWNFAGEAQSDNVVSWKLDLEFQRAHEKIWEVLWIFVGLEDLISRNKPPSRQPKYWNLVQRSLTSSTYCEKPLPEITSGREQDYLKSPN
jgi:hypothetical protein